MLNSEEGKQDFVPKYHVTGFCHKMAAVQGLLRMVFYQRCDVSRTRRRDGPWADRVLGWPRMRVFEERYKARILQLAIRLGRKVSWCFKPSQPQRIISGLGENFIKRYIVERTNKAEIRPEEQSEKAESCPENSWNEIQLKGPYRQKQTQEQSKQEWASSVGLCLKT